MPYRIYLPSGYDDPANASRRYPVLYLLHGHEDLEDYQSYKSWTDRTHVTDYADQYGMIIVFPEGLNSWYSNYWNSAPGSDEFEYYMIDDLLPFIDSTYRTEAVRGKRGIGGNSMGGYGPFKLALLHPDRFSALFSLSGVLCLDAFGPVSYLESLVKSNIGTVFGPYVQNKIYFRGNDPVSLAPTFLDWTANAGSHTRIAFRAGIFDLDMTQLMASAMHQRLGALGVPHEFGIDPGNKQTAGHNWTYWDSQIDRMLRFTWETFQDPPESPLAWSYRTIAQSFDVWGWSFSIGRPGWAWLVLDNVTQAGFQVSGKGAIGMLTVHTPGVYEAGATYKITNTKVSSAEQAGSPDGAPLEVAADSSGSLSFSVPLGDSEAAAAVHEILIEKAAVDESK